jgi:chromate transporter
MSPSNEPKAPSKRPPSLGAVAWCFAEMGLRGFGGVLAQARDVLVERRKWVTDREFAEVLGLGQLLPGGNIINVAAILGDRWAGPLGSVVAIAAMMVPTTAIAIALLAGAAQVARDPRVISAEHSVVAAAAGLLIASGFRTARTVRDPNHRGITAARLGVALLTAAIACALPRYGVPAAVIVAAPLAYFIEMRRA